MNWYPELITDFQEKGGFISSSIIRKIVNGMYATEEISPGTLLVKMSESKRKLQQIFIT